MQQRHRSEGDSFGEDPQQPHMPGLQTRAQQTQDRQQRRDKDAVGPLGAHLEVGDAIPGADEEQQGDRRQHGTRQRVKA